MQRPRAVAFDLDGTLIDSRADIAAACNHTLAWAGRAPLPEATVASFVGDGARTLLARAFALDGDAPELASLLDEFVGYYAAHPLSRSPWMRGAQAMLAGLAAESILAALVTNKARAATLAVLAALDLSTRFSAVYAGGDGPLKPHAEPLLAVARQMRVEVGELWMVGDAAQDVASARAAGCTAIAVLGGFHSEATLRAAKPDALLESLDELLPLLRA